LKRGSVNCSYRVEYGVSARGRAVADIIRMPYAVKPRRVIDRLIDKGWLDRNRRHSGEAVEAGVERLRAYSEWWLRTHGGRSDEPLDRA
jgi:hypothetical protein